VVDGGVLEEELLQFDEDLHRQYPHNHIRRFQALAQCGNNFRFAGQFGDELSTAADDAGGFALDVGVLGGAE
jgi:hypothetical protein